MPNDNAEETEVKVTVRLDVTPFRLHPDFKVGAYDGYDVFRWPEFQALAFRLGIDISRPMVRLVLDLREGHRPVALIEQTCADALTSRIEAAETALKADEPQRGHHAVDRVE